MRAALVGVDFGKGDFLASLEELALLSTTAGAQPIVSVTGRRSSPDAALFVGSGKADEIGDAIARWRGIGSADGFIGKFGLIKNSRRP